MDLPNLKDPIIPHPECKLNFSGNTPKRISILSICVLFALTISFKGFSQNAGISTNGAVPPNSAAGLDVDFANKGLLIPRVALTGAANFQPLTSHIVGMIVYNTATTGDVSPGFYINDGTKWISYTPPNGLSTGDMIYWTGSAWLLIPAGQPGQMLQLTSLGIPLWVGAGFATLTTTTLSSITSTSLTSGGNIITDSGIAVTARGVCWDTSPNPTPALTTKTIDGTGTGIFISNVTGLTTGTTYYLRAYATNSTGTTYGNQIKVITP